MAWHQWALGPEYQGIHIQGAVQECRTVSADDLVRLAVWKTSKKTPDWWSPGLQVDTPLDLNRWVLKRVSRGPGVPLTKAGTRDLYRLFGAWEVPKACQWWIQLGTPVLTSQTIWRRWQKSLAKPEEGDVRPTQIRELILRMAGWEKCLSGCVAQPLAHNAEVRSS